jgi:hypothetical protein
MRTRTLLLLAIGCGLAILLAGGIQLLRIANQRPTPSLGVGDTGTAGDVEVVVESFRADEQFAVATVTLSGVDDPEGLSGFRLVAPGDTVEYVPAESTCDGITVAEVTCTLAFPAAELAGSDRQLVFRRAGEQVRWVLVGG